ncbi:MAG: SDR family oxidoreductase [Candidatus Melainabacteria bacterium]|nr:SDR family oxidoreductase [Candidatus Melainabacteria bacterium]
MDVAIVTGAGQGIGKEAAIKLASKGLHVVCVSKSNNCKKTASEIIAKGDSAEGIILDISDYENAKKIFTDWTHSTSFKQIGVVLAAGILGPNGPFLDSSLNMWDECLRVNILGNLAVLQGLLPHMIKERFGRIITFAGGGSAYSFPEFPAYSASKTAIVRITENLNEDFKDKGDFIVVCLAPGAVDTQMLKIVKSSGATVKTQVDISEPVNFIVEFMLAKSSALSGSFVHVRDNWKDFINTGKTLSKDSYWKLRRIE